VARELREKGHELLGVRLDSGDLTYLSKKTRAMLDSAGFPKVKILASNELDEFIIRSIRDQGGRVDIYGVGTRLASCSGEGGGALGGVYKLVRFDGQPKLKVSNDISKSTLPDYKRLLRLSVATVSSIMDQFALKVADQIRRHCLRPGKSCPTQGHTGGSVFWTHAVVMEDGKLCIPSPTLDEMADRSAEQLKLLPEGSLRLETRTYIRFH
jgi:nicotinate phosphoribosyltransferase